MKVELDALDKIGTFEFVDLPPKAKPIGCIWVLQNQTHGRWKQRKV